MVAEETSRADEARGTPPELSFGPRNFNRIDVIHDEFMIQTRYSLNYRSQQSTPPGLRIKFWASEHVPYMESMEQ